MECMANSDNVIRAGLTPKLRDVPNLIENLTYLAAGQESHVIQPTLYRHTCTIYDSNSGIALSIPWHTKIYSPPVTEFSVIRMTFYLTFAEHVHMAINGPKIYLVMEGRGRVRWGRLGDGVLNSSHGSVSWDKDFDQYERQMAIQKGDAFFVAAGWDVGFRMDSEEELLDVYGAFVPV